MGREPYAVIAGGGTGGHVVPALAIGRALVARGHPPESLHYVGSARGIEARMIPGAGFPVTLLPGRGIQRRMSPRALVENAGALAGLARGSATAAWLLARRRPRVVVTVGGYASVPCALAAAAWRVPIVVHEQNAVPGAANRLTARLARASAVSFPGTPLPRAQVTGNPVRPEVLAVDRVADRGRARAALGLPAHCSVVAVVGGSLGALRLNRAVLDALPAWAERSDLAVHHVVGHRDWSLVSSSRPPAGPLHYRPVEYEERMPLVLAAADLFVCRAGGNTVAELAAVGVPSVLVPLPGAPGDHQTANARRLEEAGAAVRVADADLDGARLVGEVDALLADAGRLAAMARAASGLARRDAAERVAALVERWAR